MRGLVVPAFNPIDPIRSTLGDISANIADATTTMFSTVMNWSVNQGASVNWNASYITQSYVFAFTVAFFVGLPLLLIMHFTDVKQGRAGHSALWDVLLTRLPRWVMLSMFGASIGMGLSALVSKFNGAIVTYMFGSSAKAAADSFSKILTSALLGSGTPVFLAMVLGLIIFLSSLVLFVSSLVITIAAQLLAVLIPLGMLPDVSRKHRGLSRKFAMVYLVVLAAMPLQLFIFGFFFKMVAENLGAGTVPGMIGTSSSDGSPLANLGLLVVGSLVMLLPLLGPMALLRMVGGHMPSMSSDSGSGGSESGSGTTGASSPQDASMSSGGGSGASGGAALGESEAASGAGGASSAAGASAGGGGAAAGGAAAGGGAAGGAAAGGTAAVAAGAGAATAGVGAVAVAGLSAAGRIAHAVKSETSGKMNQTAQSMSMASMHLDGGGDE